MGQIDSLAKFQRMLCMGISGFMRTTPTAYRLHCTKKKGTARRQCWTHFFEGTNASKVINGRTTGFRKDIQSNNPKQRGID